MTWSYSYISFIGFFFYAFMNIIFKWVHFYQNELLEVEKDQ